MKYQTYPPSENMKDYVRYFWTLEGNEPYTHYSLADSCPELLFHYSGQFDELYDNGQTKVKQMANDCFLSERQFERQFLKFSGFTPKMFSRIVRFQSAMVHYGNREKSLTEIALETGYYDQSHFIHDFKEFSGHLPTEYFSGHSKATEWRE